MGFLKNRTALLVIVAVLLLAGGALAFVKRSHDNNEQVKKSQSQTSAQNNDKTMSDAETQKEDTSLQPDINKQSFRLTGATVNCSTSTVNDQTSRSCSGNIRIVPAEQPDHSPGLYKINEQTKLLHNGREEDLNNLQQLSQNQTIVQLKLQDGSSDMLAEVRYIT